MLIDDPEPFLDAFGTDVIRDGAFPFRAIFGVVEMDAFGNGTTTDREISYPSDCADLEPGEILQINGASYKVARDVPRRIDEGGWTVAKLVKV